MNPLVSVITVTYNSGSFIRDAVESVLAQTYEHFEYIIGDDCSKDDTWDIISSYNDPRIRRYRNQVNMGEYPNRNKAICMAQGMYLLFVDGDDILLTHGLDSYVNYAEKFPQAGMLVQRGYLNNVVFPALFYSKEVLANHYFGHYDLLSSSFSSNFFRLDALKEIGMLSTDYKGGDNHIRVKMAAYYPVLFVPGYVSWPRETPGSASSKLTTTISLLESYRYTKQLEDVFSRVDPSLGIDIATQMNIKASRHILNNLVRLKWKDIRMLIHGIDMNIFGLLKYAFKASADRDPLVGYTPVSPFKKDFLK